MRDVRQGLGVLKYRHTRIGSAKGAIGWDAIFRFVIVVAMQKLFLKVDRTVFNSKLDQHGHDVKQKVELERLALCASLKLAKTVL